MKKYIDFLKKLLLLLLSIIVTLNLLSLYQNGGFFNFYFLEKLNVHNILLWITIFITLILWFFLIYTDRYVWIFLIGTFIVFVSTPMLHFNKKALINYYHVYLLHYLKDNDKEENRYVMERFSCLGDQIIAHAGGEVNGYTYTDSLEALENAYHNGIRLMELDLQKTKDGKIVAVHDWEKWKENVGFMKKGKPTLKEFNSYRIKGEFTPLDMEKINKWFNSHPDAILITDKINSPKAIYREFIDKKRVRMELFSVEAVIKAIDLGITPMPSWNTVLRKLTYPKRFLKSLNIEYVVVPYKTYKKNIVFFHKLSNTSKIYLFGNYHSPIEPNYFYGRYVDDTLLENICR